MQRRGEGRLVVAVDGRLELAVQAVQVGGGRVVNAELALAADSDDHYPSPSCGSAGRADAGMLAGWGGGGGGGGDGAGRVLGGRARRVLPLGGALSCVGGPGVVSPLGLLHLRPAAPVPAIIS